MSSVAERVSWKFAALLTLVLGAVVLVAAQENMVRVGVATMQNQAGRAIQGTVERDRLVQSLNRMKPDKKTHVQVQGVALQGTTGNEVSDEAASQKCAYVLFTTLTELRSADEPYQRVPGTAQTGPTGQWSTAGNPRAQQPDPEYRVTVEYRLYRVGESSAVAGAPFSQQVAMNEVDAVSQVMERIASQVADYVKKGPPAMRE
jgi:hypothetical protein